MTARALLLASAAFLLAGCFDAQYDLKLNSDGSGKVAVDIVLDKEISREILKENNGKLQRPPQQSDLGKNAKSSQRVENGAVVISQTLAFQSLSEITGGGADVEVTRLGHNTFGMVRNRVRFATAGDRTAKGKKKSVDDLGEQMAAEIFKGHELRVTMHLPCMVETASSLSRDGQTYAPKVDKSWFSGSIVAWKVPMTVMIGMESRPGPHDFAVTCWSLSGITPGRSTTK